MNVITRAILAVAVSAVVLSGWSGASVAATAHQRIEGSVSVRSEVTDEDNGVQPVGTVTTRTWTFTPECTTGGCPTRLDRVRNSSPQVTTYRLKPRQAPNGERVYRATIHTLTDCFDDAGGVLFPGGMETTERIEVKTRRPDAQNVAQKIKGTLQVTFTPTSAAAAAGCRSGFTDATFRSVGSFTD